MRDSTSSAANGTVRTMGHISDALTRPRQPWRVAVIITASIALAAGSGVGVYALTQPAQQTVATVETPTPTPTPTPTANIAPVANFGTVSRDGLTITLEDRASDPDGTVTNLEWDMGDGTTATGHTVTHTYADWGTYTISLTVTDDRGDTATVSAAVEFVEPAPAVDTSKCPPWTTVNSVENGQHTSCAPNVCLTLTLPDPAHPECDYFHHPAYYW